MPAHFTKRVRSKLGHTGIEPAIHHNRIVGSSLAALGVSPHHFYRTMHAPKTGCLITTQEGLRAAPECRMTKGEIFLSPWDPIDNCTELLAALARQPPAAAYFSPI